MTENTDQAVITNPFLIVLVLAVAGVIDAVLTPILLALPAVAVLIFVPQPWNVSGIVLFLLPLAYFLAYLFIRDTDSSFPIGPAERVLFSKDESR